MKTVIVTAVRILRGRPLGLVAATVLAAGLAGCAGDSDTAASEVGDCPTEPVSVVVSVDQWGDIVSQLGGACARVATLLAGSGVDPHEFEPTPAAAARFGGAQLIVINGGHYDEWAAKLAATSAPAAPVVDAVQIGERSHGRTGNPHVWYDPVTVEAVADAVTAQFTALASEAGDYFSARREAFAESLTPYRETIAAIRAGAEGRSYAATETVFEDMATAVGLTDRTPPGYAASSAHETDPSPADLNAFLKLLSAGGVDVLIYNTQTEGSVPEQIRRTAEAAGIPVVEVSETIASEADSFQAWQVDQLTALAEALGVDH